MKNDGGPAFPVIGNCLAEGMSLRDYFAAAALQGICAGQWQGSVSIRVDLAYQFADVMIAERAK